MNKKLLAVAVAGALAAPGVALAQASSVTISGFFKVGVENISYGSAAATRANSSQTRVVDNSSRILFNSVEDLGNGLAAVGQLDVRFAPDQASATAVNPIGSGNTFVGLKSNSWGMLTTGRWDLHYGKSGDATVDKAALEAWATALFDYVQVPGAAGAAAVNAPIAATTRTQNVVKYDTPNWNGVSGTIAWSANPSNAATGEADMLNPAASTNTRRGDAWNINPRYDNGPFHIEYSYWNAKPDAPIATTTDQRGDVLAGSYQFGGFKIGLGWNKSRLNLSTGGLRVAERTSWSLPMSYTWGPNAIVGHYTRAGNSSSDVPGAVTDSTGARMLSVAYVYSLSKRTSLAATYAKINNDANANYNFFTSTSLGSADTTTAAGESPRLFQVTIKHAF